MKITKEKNYMMYFMKGIASIFVVLEHAVFPGVLGLYMCNLGRFAVPFFFLVTGYFAYDKDKIARSNKAKRQLIKLFKLTITTTAFYILWNLIKCDFQYEKIQRWVNGFWNHTGLIRFIFFNRAYWLASIMWYLFAIIYVYAIYIYADKYELLKWVYRLCPVILICNIIIHQFLNYEWYYVGNFLFTGIPFFFIGNYIALKEEQVNNISNKLTCTGITLGIAVTVIETALIKRNIFCTIGTIILAISMIVYSINNPSKKINAGICKVGMKYSMAIFIVHCMIRDIIQMMPIYHNSEPFKYCAPIIVVLISLLIAVIFNIISNELKRAA